MRENVYTGRLAQRGLFPALWSREILEEGVTSIARRPCLSVERLRRRTAAMEAALQDATVEGPGSGLEESGDDAHVAAALAGRTLSSPAAAATSRDFPERTLGRHRLSVRLPDDFLVHQWWLDPAAVVDVLMLQARGTTRPALTPDEILARLEAARRGFCGPW